MTARARAALRSLPGGRLLARVVLPRRAPAIALRWAILAAGVIAAI